MYVCTCVSFPFLSHFKNGDYNVMHMLAYWGSRSLEQCGRMIGGVEHLGYNNKDQSLPFAIQRSKRWTYYFKLYLSGQTDSSEPVSFSSAFEAKPDHNSVDWYETFQSRAAACRLVLISIIAEIFNDCCTLYEWWLPMIDLQHRSYRLRNQDWKQLMWAIDLLQAMAGHSVSP